MIRLIQTALLFLICSLAFAHHSTTGHYDRNSFMEIEGTISSVHWKNPHIKFGLELTDESGKIIEWEVELAALSIYRSRGFGDQFLHVGEPIKVYGNPAFDGSSEMGGRNLLLSDGQEIFVIGTPHFTDTTKSIGLNPKQDAQQERLARENADGIYRVWSTIISDPSFPMFQGGYPVNESSAQAQADFDPLAPERFECWDKGMPYLMISPHPLEFVRDGDDILMRFEEDDAVRRIHMTADGAKLPEDFFHLGYSVGKWEGQTLVIETSNVSAIKFDDAGTPLSKSARFVERFDLSEDETRLDYRISIFDSETFTEPFDLTRFWTWVPSRTVGEWNCET